MRQNKRKHRMARPSVSVPLAQRRWCQLLVAILEAFTMVTLLVSIVICIYFVYQRVTREAFFPLRRIVITEPLRYGSSDVISSVVAAGSEADLLHIDVQKIAKNIDEISWVRHASVEKHWPDSLYIHIDERYPIVRWDKNTYLDKDGVRFSLPNQPIEDLFPATGPNGYERKVLERYRQIEPWLLGQQISAKAIRLDPRLIWHITLDNDIDIILGRHELNERLKKLVVVYRRVIKPYQQYIASVDLRYQDGFSVRWKPGMRPKTATSTQ